MLFFSVICSPNLSYFETGPVAISRSRNCSKRAMPVEEKTMTGNKHEGTTWQTHTYCSPATMHQLPCVSVHLHRHHEHACEAKQPPLKTTSKLWQPWTKLESSMMGFHTKMNHWNKTTLELRQNLGSCMGWSSSFIVLYSETLVFRPHMGLSKAVLHYCTYLLTYSLVDWRLGHCELNQDNIRLSFHEQLLKTKKCARSVTTGCYWH